jgi:ketol-acid reductoisomerase
MRGFLTRYNITNVVGSAFKHCTACSNSIIYEYEERGIDFIIDALNKSANFLEDISGLTIMKKQTEEMMNNTNYEIPDDDDFEINDNNDNNNNNNNDSNNNVDKNNILGIGSNDDKKTKANDKKSVIDLFADI